MERGKADQSRPAGVVDDWEVGGLAAGAGAGTVAAAEGVLIVVGLEEEVLFAADFLEGGCRGSAADWGAAAEGDEKGFRDAFSADARCALEVAASVMSVVIAWFWSEASRAAACLFEVEEVGSVPASVTLRREEGFVALVVRLLMPEWVLARGLEAVWVPDAVERLLAVMEEEDGVRLGAVGIMDAVCGEEGLAWIEG